MISDSVDQSKMKEVLVNKSRLWRMAVVALEAR